MSGNEVAKKSNQEIPWVNYWAKYRAFDESGELWEYEYKPSLEEPEGDDKGYWGPPPGRPDGLRSEKVSIGNWKESLEERE